MKTITESKRGCGFRKKGGLYFFSPGIGLSCGRLPIPLTVCPCCGNGIKFTRSFQWIKWELLQYGDCETGGEKCCTCPFVTALTDVISGGKGLGLMWVGEKFYPTPADFIREGNKQGVSKRITSVPREFEVGKTWIATAHRKAIFDPETKEYVAGIFQMFCPTEIQYVVKGDESADELAALEKRGITPVRIQYETPEDLNGFAQANEIEGAILSGDAAAIERFGGIEDQE